MKRVYTNENRILVSHAKNILDHAGIENQLNNEFAAGALGDIAPLDAWMELWVVDDDQYDSARDHLTALTDMGTTEDSHHTDNTSWICQQCQESNPGNFAHCWNCQSPAA